MATMREIRDAILDDISSAIDNFDPFEEGDRVDIEFEVMIEMASGVRVSRKEMYSRYYRRESSKSSRSA